MRAKLLGLVLAPLMLGFPLIMGLLWYWGEVYYHRLMVSRVGSDLATAHGYFERVVDGVGSSVQGLAGSHALARTLAEETPAGVSALLAARKGGLGLDFLNLLDVNGRVLHASTATASGGPAGTVEPSSSHRSGVTTGLPTVRVSDTFQMFRYCASNPAIGSGSSNSGSSCPASM